MKFLISNYATDTQSECMYINTTLNLLGSCKSTIWNEKEISAYDILDLTSPDFYLAHVSNINGQALNYIQNSKTIELIINITGASQENVDLLEQKLASANIKCSFLFHNNSDHGLVSKKHRIVYIGHGADIFLNNNFPKYKLENAVFVGQESEIKPLGDTYHIISTNRKLKDLVDIYMPITKLSNLYDKYDNCVIRYFGKLIPQLFYDSVYRGNKVYYSLDNENVKNEAIEKINKLLRLDIDITNPSTIDPKMIKDSVKSRHTCLHRVKSLLSQLPCKDSIQNIDNIIDIYIKKD
jgi:hypothetical protein